MNRQALYQNIKKDALKLAEEELRNDRYYQIVYVGPEHRPSDAKVLNPDWHPYYMRVQRTSDGIRFSLVVRDGEIAYFTQKKQAVPDFAGPAYKALQKTLAKYKTELTTLELVDIFNKTEGATATWRT